MPVAFDLSPDFTTIIDGLEAVTLTRRDATVVPVAAALRRRVSEQEAATSNGRFTRSDVKWHLPLDVVGAPPEIGATVTDGDGEVWTVLQADHDASTGRYRLWTRKLDLRQTATDLITIQEASWSKDDHGALSPAWSNVQADVPARVQPIEGVLEIEHDKRLVRVTHRIFLAAAVSITEKHRILRPATSEVFHVVSVENAERLDALFTINVVKTPWLVE